MSRLSWLFLSSLLLFCVSGCGEPKPEKGSEVGIVQSSTEPDATLQGEDLRRPRYGIVESMRLDLATPRHPSDGQGSAEIEILWPEDGRLVAGGQGRFQIDFEVGPLGIAEGGALYLQASPFWAWSTPQRQNPDDPGFTEVSTSAEGVQLEAQAVDRQLMTVQIQGRAMKAGEKIRLIYGAGPAMARVDRFAERGQRLWLAVDGDGDGVRGLIASSPSVDIEPAAAATLWVVGPSTARPGEAVRIHLSLLDARGNGPVPEPVDLRLTLGERSLEKSSSELSASGHWTLPWTFAQPGIHRLQAVVTLSDGRVLDGEAPPVLVADAARPVYWADLQVHSRISDGTGEPADLYAYGRDVARLDVMSVTDHDHWGLKFLDNDEETWERIQAVTGSFHRPGVFVTVRGFEWTNWIHGHRHVLLFDDGAFPIFSSIDEDYDEPDELWAALKDREALTVAHHSAGGPIATDWSFAPDPRLEPVTEIVSVHGSSEAEDSPLRIGQWVPGNSVRQAVFDRGYRLGFIGSTDGHDGHPGLGHLVSPSDGVAAILADELTRDGIYQALLQRRSYATSGPRILLRTLVAGYRMGSELPVQDGVVQPKDGDERLPLGADQWWVQILAPGEIERLDLIDKQGIRSFPCEGRECVFQGRLPELAAGDVLYVRAVQKDGHFAVSSPYFFVQP